MAHLVSILNNLVALAGRPAFTGCRTGRSRESQSYKLNESCKAGLQRPRGKFDGRVLYGKTIA
jgi:hypothetical protein